MPPANKTKLHEESDLKKFIAIFSGNMLFFVLSLLLMLLMAFAVTGYMLPVYRISSSILIRETETQQSNNNSNDYLNSSLFTRNQNFQNELWVLKSSPVLDQAIRNLDLSVTYFRKEGLRFKEAYKDVPFTIDLIPDHPQPMDVRFRIVFLSETDFKIESDEGETFVMNNDSEQQLRKLENWKFHGTGKVGDLIGDQHLAIIVRRADTVIPVERNITYGFEFRTVESLRDELKKNLETKVVDKMATVIEISLKSGSLSKGTDFVDEMMRVYTEQDLERKNHIASITIDYIEKQLNEISDSLSQTENKLQRFRSSNQLLNIDDQANNISAQYMNLQNQVAELVARKRYYDYVSDYLRKNENFSNMIVPASLGIQDVLLNDLMAQLIAVQAQRSNLVENNQEKNPQVQTLGVQIENIKKTITDNITAVSKTTSISIEELEKRIKKIEADISRLPMTQRLLGNIERKYRLNDAIYNYLLEKRAEAKITKASNLSDALIIEPAKMVGLKPISPNLKLNLLIAVLVGLLFPYGFVSVRNMLNDKIEVQEDLEKLADVPVLGKILHNNHHIEKVMHEFPNSNISESFRALRTNLEFFARLEGSKVLMVTSCLEGEGKTFVAQNLAYSYAQMSKKTVLVNFDLRKSRDIIDTKGAGKEGLSSYLAGTLTLDEIISPSDSPNLSYIKAGMLPPNPVEMVAMERTRLLIGRLRERFDIVILDTTPLAQVPDAYLLFESCDIRIIVSRMNFTIRKVYSEIMSDLKRKNIGQLCVVLNDNKLFANRYGYGYGYNNKVMDNNYWLNKLKRRKRPVKAPAHIKESILKNMAN